MPFLVDLLRGSHGYTSFESNLISDTPNGSIGKRRIEVAVASHLHLSLLVLLYECEGSGVAGAFRLRSSGWSRA